jgi:S1-C subfamily serine protease
MGSRVGKASLNEANVSVELRSRKVSNDQVGLQKAQMLLGLTLARISSVDISEDGNPQFGFESTSNRVFRDSQVIHGSVTSLANDGYFMTAGHVVRGSDRLVLVTWEGTEASLKEVRVVWVSKEADLAIVHAPVYVADYPQWCNSNRSANSKVMVDTVAQGFRSGRLFGKVFLRRLSPRKDSYRFFYHNAPLMPGDSGSALLTSKGELLGINVATMSINSERNGLMQMSRTLRPRVSMIEEIVRVDRSRSNSLGRRSSDPSKRFNGMEVARR